MPERTCRQQTIQAHRWWLLSNRTAQGIVSQLAKVWVLRQKLQWPSGETDNLVKGMLSLFSTKTAPLPTSGRTIGLTLLTAEVIEEGERVLLPVKDLFTRLNVLLIRNMILYRREIAGLKPGYLVLKEPEKGNLYLLFKVNESPLYLMSLHSNSLRYTCAS